ncbi:hypothetical protein WJX74_000955 [Apatococcus lobatus]|uniref:protein-serine/threonine phosphatase n=1 Tax=Apatococcus lobatus TaxID=904363 RepID=A0AAW1R2I0_9CHLO
MGPDESDLKAAEELKFKANAAFKEKNYEEALVEYTKAIQLAPTSAIFFANRAFTHIRLESCGSAVADATRAIELDPKYVKGYYRRADANFALGKFKLAFKDFRMAAKYAPSDPDLRKKLAETERVVKRLRFEEAIASEEEVPAAETLDLSTLKIEADYDGPEMEGTEADGYRVTLPFVEALLEHFKAQKGLHRRFACQILLSARSILKSLPSLVDIPLEDSQQFTVCGDVHGQFYDLLNIFKINGLPSESNPYLFNGDFVDRGSFSVEIILTLLAFKCLYPDHVHLARGNHESRHMNQVYGFEGEVKHKFNGTVMDLFRELFCWLPLAHVINKRVIVVHGGLFARDGVTLDDIRKVDRNRQPPDDGLMCELLWSDPQPSKGRSPNKRGVGVAFGPDVTRAFLELNKLDLLVRSHEAKPDGYEVEHNGDCVTVFSAPNYCDQMGNKGAFIRFTGADMIPQFTTFEAVPHPDVKAMAYASSMFGSSLLGV